jgi:thiamine pyrophosphate-dependent acetolactate synthase large subunit-like protein
MERKGNIGDLLVRTLAAAGVRRIYGIVGDSLTASLKRCGRMPH